MKKLIIKITAITILIGGLTFNISISKTNTINNEVDLAIVANSSMAIGESGLGYKCKYYPPIYDCMICNGPYSYCPSWAC